MLTGYLSLLAVAHPFLGKSSGELVLIFMKGGESLLDGMKVAEVLTIVVEYSQLLHLLQPPSVFLPHCDVVVPQCCPYLIG